MTELLLITDIPRLRQVFSRLSDIHDIRLRVSTSLESGAKEIAAEKPAIVFVQTHLSGFSAEILLMHLKKQLGKRRTRFVLLCAKGQVSEEVLKQYQGHIDSALDDNQLYDAIIDVVNSTKQSVRTVSSADLSQADEFEEDSPVKAFKQEDPAQLQKELPATDNLLPATSSSTPPPETSLEEQGVIYAPRTPLSVYSEFTSSFDNAVSNMPPKEPTQDATHWSGLPEDANDIEPANTRSKWVTFLLWGVPILVVVVAVTMLQQYFSQPKPLDIAPKTAVVPPKSEAPTTPAAVDKPATELPAAAPLTTIKPAATRLTKLPAFIPSDNRDKAYSRTNPGWERYKGRKTEYKVFREEGSIKAIQVIDRNGKGLSETFTLELLKQMVPSPSFVLESSEKKDGYEIQRGRLAEDIAMVYYRDADSARLRAFVITWK